ncbi:hypothetical protein P4S72_17225 [Vibrio sp. PP-XX7]
MMVQEQLYPMQPNVKVVAIQTSTPPRIKTANDQRSKLQEMPGDNGTQMLSTYSNHRAAYDDVFTQSKGYVFRSGWQTQAIADMADHTHTAVSQETGPVNPANKQFGNTSYNGNAQNQQLALITALHGMADNGNDTDPYIQAAAAAMTFGTSITTHNKVEKIKRCARNGFWFCLQAGAKWQACGRSYPC